MLLVSALLAAVIALPQAREGRPPDSDQTVNVARGARLSIDNFAGEVVVKTWDRDQLRVQARHPSRTKVEVKTGAATVIVRATTSGAPGSVDYEITAPAWMAMKIEGTYNFITVEGAQSEVSAITTRGDVIVRGGSGTVVAKSIEGEVVVEGTRGRVTASSVNQGIRISDVSGDISAETNNGSILLTKITSSAVEATTINGQVVYEGSIADKGRYRFTTHNGNITATIPDSSNVTLAARSYNGNISVQHDVKAPPADDTRRGRRVTYTLGNGSAEMEMETFGGNIRVRRPGATTAPKPKDKDRDPLLGSVVCDPEHSPGPTL